MKAKMVHAETEFYVLQVHKQVLMFEMMFMVTVLCMWKRRQHARLVRLERIRASSGRRIERFRRSRILQRETRGRSLIQSDFTTFFTQTCFYVCNYPTYAEFICLSKCLLLLVPLPDSTSIHDRF